MVAEIPYWAIVITILSAVLVTTLHIAGEYFLDWKRGTNKNEKEISRTVSILQVTEREIHEYGVGKISLKDKERRDVIDYLKNDFPKLTKKQQLLASKFRSDCDTTIRALRYVQLIALCIFAYSTYAILAQLSLGFLVVGGNIFIIVASTLLVVQIAVKEWMVKREGYRVLSILRKAFETFGEEIPIDLNGWIKRVYEKGERLSIEEIDIILRKIGLHVSKREISIAIFNFYYPTPEEKSKAIESIAVTVVTNGKLLKRQDGSPIKYDDLDPELQEGFVNLVLAYISQNDYGVMAKTKQDNRLP